MAWNEPGGNRKDQDPWGGGKRGGEQGPPDLDEALKKGIEKLNTLFGGKGDSGRGGSGNGGGVGGGSGSGGGFGGIIALVGILLLVYVGFQSFYTVDERERAVVLRFGQYQDTAGPGLRFKVPLIDDIYKVEVTNVRSFSSRGHMLTEDENIVEVNLQVQYVVNDPRNYVLAIRDPRLAIEYATDSALRHEVGGSELHQVLTEGRAELAVRIQERLQMFLDSYASGMRIVKVNVESTQPPGEVQAAFQDVQRAKEDEQRVREEAETYRNRIVPEARGQAQRMLEEATAYRAEVIERAKGEAVRFVKLLDAYTKAPAVTRDRLYLDTIEKVLSSTSKVMVDVEGGNNMLYLPLDRLAQATSGSVPRAKSELAPQAYGSSQDDIQALTDKVLEELRARQETQTRRGR